MLCKNVNRRLSPSTSTAAAITFFLGVFLTHFEVLEGELPKSCCCIISAIWGLLLHTGDGHPQQTGLYQQVCGKSQGNSLRLHRSFQYEVHSELLSMLVKTLPWQTRNLTLPPFQTSAPHVTLPNMPYRCQTTASQSKVVSSALPGQKSEALNHRAAHSSQEQKGESPGLALTSQPT